MNSYSDVDGVPAGASAWLLTEVLREEWGFEGTVVSDYWAVPFLATMHRVASGYAEAGALAIEAGIDVELPDTLGYGDGLVELVRSGALDEALVDRAARRALLAKARLGLLDAGWTPEGSVAHAAEVDLDSPANRELAREIAERSVVLLDAGTALPIRSAQRPLPQKVAVIGPCADDPLTFMGCYAFPTHVLPRHPRAGLGIEVPTALDALRAELPEVEIVHEPGCTVLGEDRAGFPAAVAAASGADLCVALVGDLAGLFGHGSSGEGCDAEDLRLPGVQADLVEELLATGTPVVLVVVSGRPYALGELAWSRRGSGPVVLPRRGGRVRDRGGALRAAVPRRPAASADPASCGWPAQHLPAATAGRHRECRHHDGGLHPALPLRVRRLVHLLRAGRGARQRRRDRHRRGGGGERGRDEHRRTGRRRGRPGLPARPGGAGRPAGEAADRLRSRPPRSGCSAELVFEIHADRTAYTDASLERIVEAGEVQFIVGTSAADERARVPVQLTGATRVVGHDRRLDTPVRVAHRATH